MINNPPRKLSQLLKDSLDEIKNKNITLWQLSNQLSTRTYGIFIILLTIPCFLPGASIFGGLLLLLFSLQMTLGIQKVWLPAIIGHYTIKKETLDKGFNTILPKLLRFEQYIKPRWAILSTKLALQCMGIIISLFAFIILMPIPLSNFIPSLCLLFLGFGILQKDGLITILSATIGIIYCLTFLVFLEAIVTTLLKWIN